MSSSHRPTIRVNCPQCIAGLDVDARQAGQRVECPKCHFSLLVPLAGTAGANLFDDLLDTDDPADGMESQLTAGTADSGSDFRPGRDTPARSEPPHNPLLHDFDFDGTLVEPDDSQPEIRPVFRPVTKPGPAGTAKPVPNAEARPPKSLSAGTKAPQRPKSPIAAITDDDLELDLQLAPLDSAPLEPPDGINPLEINPDAPIRVDGIEMDNLGTGSIPVKCHICDSVLHAAADMLNRTVVCPDCGSTVVVVPRTKTRSDVPTGARANRDWKEVVEQRDSHDFRLAVPVELPAEPMEKDWGLPDEEADLMRPLPTLEPVLDEEGDDILAGAPVTRRVESDRISSAPFVGGKRAAEEQTQRRAKRQVVPSKRPAVSGRTDGKKGGVAGRGAVDSGDESLPSEGEEDSVTRSQSRRVLAVRDRSSSHTNKAVTGPETAETDGEIPAGDKGKWTAQGRYIIKLPDMGAFRGSLRGWLLEVVKDYELWIRAAAAAVCFGFTAWMGNIVTGAMNSEQMNGGEQVMRIVFPAVFGGICLLAGSVIILMTGSLLFQQSGDRRPRIGEWPGLGIGEWGESALFWGVSLWLASLPGLLVGVPLLFSPMKGLAFVVAALSMFVFSPPMLLAAWYNGSPFQVWSATVFRHFRGGQTDWLRFLPGSMAGWLLFLVGYGIMCIPVPFSSFAGAALQVAGILLFATNAGLYCGLMAQKIEHTER